MSSLQITTAIGFDIKAKKEVEQTYDIPIAAAIQFIQSVLADMPYDEVPDYLKQLKAKKCKK